MSISLKDLDRDSDDEEDVVYKDARFFAKRISSCVVALGLLFAFGYFGIRLRGGERDPPNFLCDADRAYINYTRYGVAVTHSLDTGHPILHLFHAAEFKVTNLHFDLPPNATENATSPVVDHSLCSEGVFSTERGGLYRLQCGARESSKMPVWDQVIPPQYDSVLCYLEVAFATPTVTLTALSPVVSCEAGMEGAVAHATCIGKNVVIGLATEQAPGGDLAAGGGGGANGSTPAEAAPGGGGEVTVAVEASLYPLGIYNSSLEFVLIF